MIAAGKEALQALAGEEDPTNKVAPYDEEYEAREDEDGAKGEGTELVEQAKGEENENKVPVPIMNQKLNVNSNI